MDFLHKHKKYLVIALSAMSLILMAATGREGYTPGPIENGFGFLTSTTQSFFHNIGDWIADRVTFLRNMNDLHEENQRLREEVQLLQIENSRLLFVEQENATLVELLDIPHRYTEYPMMGANIIARDPGNWLSTVIVNRGSRDGIMNNMVVLAPGGLAGRISKVGYNYAIVTPLIEDNSNVSAATLRSGDIGIVRGDVNLASMELLRMERISSTADISVGDEVITSHISSIYPPGIRIGHIVSMGVESNGMRYALIEPSVDFSRLEALLIITELFYLELID